jgi:tyrosinase
MSEIQNPSSTRRVFVLGSVATALLAATDGVNAAPGNVQVRPDITSSAGQRMIDLYAAAIKAMQEPAINYPPQPQSWTFQTYIHGVPTNPFDPANSGSLLTGTAELRQRVDEIYGNPAAGTPQSAWKDAARECWASCTHASPYFTIWHRWYLYYFERICRKMCNDPSFTLPYWNYASDIGSSLQLPAKFTDQSTPQLLFDDRGLGFANPQGTGSQNIAMNNGGYIPYSLIDYGPALGAGAMFPSPAPSDSDFSRLGFTGRLENRPHNMVHDSIGGWMGNPASAAGDPIFFVHHCQVDRLYASWQAKPATSYNWGADPTDPDETTWKNQPSSFVDETGKLIKVKLADALQTEALGYKYDTLAGPPSQQLTTLSEGPSAVASVRASQVQLAAMQSNGFAVGTRGGSVTLAPESPGPLRTPGPRSAPTSATTLVLEGLKLLRRPPAPLSVFINLPKGATPELNGPYYVGTLNLFNFDLGTGGIMTHNPSGSHATHDAGTPKTDVRFNVADVLARQRAQGLWDGGAITVSVTTIGANAPADVTYVTFEGVTLSP